MFFYADESYRLREVYSENQAVFDVFPIYLSEFHNTDAQKAMRGVDFETGMRRGKGFVNSVYDDKALINSAVFSEVWRPVRLRHSLEVTACDGRRGWGSLQLERSFNTRAFSTRDEVTISQFSRHLAHALTAPCANITQFAEHGRPAVLVVDENGRIDLASDGALLMLALAHGEAIGPAHATRLPGWAMHLVANFVRLWQGLPVPPSVMLRRNATGLFSFKLYAFDAKSAADGRLSMAMQMQHFPPLGLHVETVGYQLGLSERQRQLCTDLIEGYSHAQIAARMGVKESTVADHARETYRKLGVHKRRDLARRFSSAAAAASE